MSELTIGTAGVASIISSGVNPISTVTATGVAGAAIAAGQVVYADPSANNQLKPAQATIKLQAAAVVGIALSSAALNQPVTYATSGDVQVGTVTGGTLMSGSVYLLAAGTAGNIVAAIDGSAPATGNYVTVVGIGNGTMQGSANILRLALIPSAIRL